MGMGRISWNSFTKGDVFQKDNWVFCQSTIENCLKSHWGPRTVIDFCCFACSQEHSLYWFCSFLTLRISLDMISWQTSQSKLRTVMNMPSSVAFSLTFLNEISSNWITKPFLYKKLANKKSKQCDDISGTPLKNQIFWDFWEWHWALLYPPFPHHPPMSSNDGVAQSSATNQHFNRIFAILLLTNFVWRKIDKISCIVAFLAVLMFNKHGLLQDHFRKRSLFFPRLWGYWGILTIYFKIFA